MKVTKVRTVTVCMFILSGLLLILAASCSCLKGLKKAGGEQKHQAEPAKEHVKEKPFVANKFCFVCHADFEGEKFAARHEKAGIGCERCHGESERHRSDEANITPPDLLYPRERIIPTCMMCHPRQRIKHVKAHKTILAGAATIFDEKAPEGPAKVCTDCHSRHHRMNTRTIRWNKVTGEVIKKE